MAVTGQCRFKFQLWDAESGGSQIGTEYTSPPIFVDAGLFVVDVDFGVPGTNSVDGHARWMDIWVQCGQDQAFTHLTEIPPPGSGITKRLSLAPVPYAMALPGFYTQRNSDPLQAPNLIGGFIGTTLESGNFVTSGVRGATISGGGAAGHQNVVTDNYGVVGGGQGNLAGNNPNSPTDATHATVNGGYANGALGPNSTIGGGAYNSTAGESSTVAGGALNSAGGTSSTVGGGRDNLADGAESTVSGGAGNRAYGIESAIGGGYGNTADGLLSTVPGGEFNQAGGAFSFAAGLKAGVRNAAEVGGNDTDGDEGTFVWADATNAEFMSTGPNQFLIRAQGGVGIGTNAPTRQLEVHDFPDVEIGLKPDHPNGRLWTIQSSNPDYGGQISESFQIIDRTAGVSRLLIDTEGQVGIGTSAPRGALEVAGGPFIVSPPIGNSCCLQQPQTWCEPQSCMLAVCAIAPECCDGGQSGWDDFCAQLAGTYCGSLCYSGVAIGTASPLAPLDIAGGADSNGGNDPGGISLAWHGGGFRHFIATRHNSASTADNAIEIWVNRSATANGSISPGTGNARMLSLSGDGRVNLGRNNNTDEADSTVGGGNQNSASAIFSTIAGGQANEASGQWSGVGGGTGNSASGWFSSIAGGWVNVASGTSSVVSGGESNMAGGDYSTVAGGFDNIASGDFSFAAGRKAVASTTGSFHWADSQSEECTYFSGPADSFWVDAHGGVRFMTDVEWIGNPNRCTAQAFWSGVTLAPGSSSWASISDRNLKENFAEINKTELLERLANVPVSTWNYKSQDDSIRHIGPMAQDFHAAFGVGEEDTKITTIDADGVALAAIQGLYEIAREKDCKIDSLEGEKDALEARIAALEAMMNQFLAGRNGGGQ